MSGKLRSILRSIKKTDLMWRYTYNLPPTIDYAASREGSLRADELKIIESLNSEGIAVISIEQLLTDSYQIQQLSLAVQNLITEKKSVIADLRANAGNSSEIGKKTFNLEALGTEITLDPESPFARIALSESLINIANAYFKMRAKLRYYNVWYTAASPATARESQLWHFDREDNYILKIFLYLDDVDEGSGPFTYAPGTHRKGRSRSITPEYFLEGGVRRTNDEQMASVFPRAKWIRCTGKKGTLIFADTRGYHKGGEARTKDRLMFTCMYTSPASESKDLMKLPPEAELGSLTTKQKRALGIKY